jgi:cystathionine gamma-lyase
LARPDDRRSVGDGTRVLRAGLPPPGQGESLLPGPTFASLFHVRGDPADAPYVYGRYDNPTWTRWEEALSELEGGPAVAFASGMAAASALLLTLLRPGDVLVAPADGYPAVRELAEGHLAARGVRTQLLPTADHGWTDAAEGARLVWLETPSNPGLDVCHVAAISRAAHDAGALVAVDNTTATPLGQSPLALGADFSIASDTKHLGGHGDLVLGHVAAADPARAEELREWRRVTGAIPGPFEAWLAHRSLATLDLRLERACATALALAERLAAREDVTAVRYPGLAGDPAHELAGRQMLRFGTLVSFDLGSRARAERFLAECELVVEATSFGGLHSSAERRARWPGNDVPEGFVRFSVGCEDQADLIADVERALFRSMAAG